MTVTVASPVRCVKSWAPVAAALRHWQESSAGLRHVGTSVCARVPKGTRHSGQVLWATEVRHSKVGIAWGWVYQQDGIVVMLNPLSVVTNLALVDDDSGDPLSFGQLMCCLNAIIYALPWQDCIRATL